MQSVRVPARISAARTCFAMLRSARRVHAFVLATGVLFGGAGVNAQAGDVPVVAAAADLNRALPEIVASFTRRTGKTVTLTFGSSGAFTQQIQNGAPFQLFLSADERYVERLTAARKTEDDGVLYATGRIALFLPHGSHVKADSMLYGLAAAIRGGLIKRFAIANPVHAPYGKAAQQALEARSVWESLRPTLVLGENASQATQFAISGSTEGGIIPLSLARTRAVERAGTLSIIAARMHEPLQQRVVLLKGAGPTARAFYEFLQSRTARDIFSRYGFTLPPT